MRYRKYFDCFIKQGFNPLIFKGQFEKVSVAQAIGADFGCCPLGNTSLDFFNLPVNYYGDSKLILQIKNALI